MRQHAPEFDSGWVGADPDDDLDERMADEDEAWDRAQPHVGTALGPVSPAALGPVLAGEPLTILAEQPESGNDLSLDGRHALLAELEDAYASGARTIVTVPPVAGDRSDDDALWLAGRSQVHVVRFAPDDALDSSGGALPDGWGGVAVPASDRARLEAAAALSTTMACPLRILAGKPAEGARAAEWVVASGVAPNRLSVGGCGWRSDPSAAKATTATGASIVLPAARTADAEAFAHDVAALVDAGVADRLLVSAGLECPEDLLARGGPRGLGWVMERIPLALMEAGLDALAVRGILVDNPARTLTIGPGE